MNIDVAWCASRVGNSAMHPIVQRILALGSRALFFGFESCDKLAVCQCVWSKKKQRIDKGCYARNLSMHVTKQQAAH
jgi:hypothetical protein